MRPSRWFVVLAVLGGTALRAPGLAGQERSQNLTRAHEILQTIKRDIERNYYDSTFHGLNLDSSYRRADGALNSAASLPDMLAIISQFAADLHDSHTFFIPPSQVAEVKYGFSWGIVGDNAYVDHVTRGSDAEAKGLAVGDRIIGIDGMQLDRRSNQIIQFVYYTLQPRRTVTVAVEKPDHSRSQVQVAAQVRQGIRVYDATTLEGWGRIIREAEESAYSARHRWYAFGDSVLVWKMVTFNVSDESIDDMIGQARGCRALVLDLRQNGGGTQTAMLRLIGSLFDRQVLVGRVVTRTKRDSLVARPRRNPYRGEVMVLIDNGSASASEITARVLQIQHRGTIVGDRSAGATMGNRGWSYLAGFERGYPYAIAVTVQDIVMSDSSRLEGRGVIPDVEVLPTPADLANERDPAMSVALNLVGVALSATNAAQLFRERRRN